jgi:hypothetical protein
MESIVLIGQNVSDLDINKREFSWGVPKKIIVSSKNRMIKTKENLWKWSNNFM